MLKIPLPLILITMLVAPVLHAQSQQWELVWQEEFNYSGLPDDDLWRYEEGYVRNNEKQYYIDYVRYYERR